MRKAIWLYLPAASFILLGALSVQAEDLSKHVLKVVAGSTLDESGTPPFHLKATYSPSSDRDKDSNRVGEIEIWWQSPTRWRRELIAPGFHQITIVDGQHQWQKNDGDYLPEWLYQLSTAITRPVPMPSDVLALHVTTAEVRHMKFPPGEQTDIDWTSANGAGDYQSLGKGNVALINKGNGDQLFYTGGPGFGGLYKDFQDFHGRSIARTVAAGSPEVTAKITLLEDLAPTAAGFFDTAAPGGDALPIDILALSEPDLRSHLAPLQPLAWPPLRDGPLDGIVWTQIGLDRTGKIREMSPPVADNPGVNLTAAAAFRTMQFQPFLRNGIPVEVSGRISLTFKTTRPVGVETFDSARGYFERGRKASSLGTGASAPYILHAEFQAGAGNGSVATGRYEDTWLSPTEWRREAWFGSSHLVRAQLGDKHYLVAEGAQANILRLVMTIFEPIPASDTMTESDWRIRRDPVNGVNAIRVFRGPEGPNGELDPGHSQGYWFAETGELLKTYTSGLEVRPEHLQPYAGVLTPRTIDVLQGDKLALRLTVKEIGPAGQVDTKQFQMKGHEWQRAFTAETR